MKHVKWIISAVCLLFAGACVVTLIRLSAVRKIHGDTLPNQIVDGLGRVVETAYPSVMYGGRLYTWAKMSADGQYELPQGYLPEGYTYAGELADIGTGTPAKDFQFSAVFNAFGQLYSNPDKPDNICLRITTYWLKDCYVLFNVKG